VSSSLRGFYDDNFNNSTGANVEKSSGVEFHPTFDWSLTEVPNWLFKVGAAYNARDYTEKSVTDQAVEISETVSGKLSDHVLLQVEDRFTVTQEPELLGPEATPLRVQGNNLHNTGKFGLPIRNFIKGWDFVVNYQNDVFDYDNPDYQPLLNRMEHKADASVQYHTGSGFFTKTGVVSLGYQFEDSEYSDQLLYQGRTGTKYVLKKETVIISGVPTTVYVPTAESYSLNPDNLESDIRNNRSHAAFLGYSEQITKQLDFSARGGIQYYDFYNTERTKTTPLAQGDVTWKYDKKARVQVGVRYQHSATDVLVGNSSGGAQILTKDGLVMDAKTLVAYVSWETPVVWDRLVFTTGGFYQQAKFEGGYFNEGSDKETFYSLDSKLSLELSKKVLFFDVGYAYTQLSSTDRPFERNRGYLGLTAKY